MYVCLPSHTTYTTTHPQVASEKAARMAAEECYKTELRAHKHTEELVLQLRTLLLRDDSTRGTRTVTTAPTPGCGCAHVHNHHHAAHSTTHTSAGGSPSAVGSTATNVVGEGAPATEATLRRLASDNRHVREEVQAIKSMIQQELTSPRAADVGMSGHSSQVQGKHQVYY